MPEEREENIFLQKESAVIHCKRQTNAPTKKKGKEKKRYMIHERAPKPAGSFADLCCRTHYAVTNSHSRQQRGVKTTRMLTRFEVHHLSVKSIIRDGELGELQFVESVDVLLALRPVIHNVF